MTDLLTIKQFKDFLTQHQQKTFKKGEIIVFQGEVPRGAFVVKSGVVKAYNLSTNGDEKPVAFYGPDSNFPGPWVYGKMANSTYYYEAFTPEVTVYMIERDEFVRFIKSRPQFIYQELERYISDELGKSMRLNALQHSKASDKLLYTLHYLSLSHGKKIAPQKIEITLDLTHQDFANLTGLTRETAATELNKLKKANIIEYGKGKAYTLDLSKLMKLLNDEYIADLDIKL